jgi:hypothetical protein
MSIKSIDKARPSGTVVHCARCRAELTAAEMRCAVCGTEVKGELLTSLSPPFEPFGPYRNISLLLAAVATALFGVSLKQGWIELAGSLGGLLFTAAFFLANRTALLLTTIRVYENGLEMNIPRSINKTVYLPWDCLMDYRFEGNLFFYTYKPNGLKVLTNGRSPASWPYFCFPKKLKISDTQTVELLRSSLPTKADIQKEM